MLVTHPAAGNHGHLQFRPAKTTIFFMRRPKGIKTKNPLTKRFKITATGKVMRSTPAAATWPKPKTPSAAAASARSPSWIHRCLSHHAKHAVQPSISPNVQRQL
jgi:hypothetical protein